jgi:hypothetical protein
MRARACPCVRMHAGECAQVVLLLLRLMLLRVLLLVLKLQLCLEAGLAGACGQANATDAAAPSGG